MEGEVIDILHICSAITPFGFANCKYGGVEEQRSRIKHIIAP